MNVHLIQGEFSTDDTLDLITQLIQVKIKYHENKIATHTSEEDIKARESKIKSLQKELFELRRNIQSTPHNLKIEGVLKIE